MSLAPPFHRAVARVLSGAFALAVFVPGAADAQAGTGASPSPASGDAALRTDFEPAATLALRLVDAETGDTLPGCVRIAAGDGEGWLDLGADLEARAHGLGNDYRALGWHVLSAGAEIRVPAGPLEIEAFSGLDFDGTALSVEVDAEAREQAELPLRRLFDAGGAGWVAGNTHLHLRGMTKEAADRYLVEVSVADGLEVVFLSYAERALVDRDYISNDYTREDLERISTPRLLFGDGTEYRHNFGRGGEGYGHVMLLDLAGRILPASVGPGITGEGTDGTPLGPGIEEGIRRGATVIWCHNRFGFERLPSWLRGQVHAQNIFDGGSYDGYEETYYRYLDLGLEAPFSTGTDWFIFDFSRVYVRLPGDAPLAIPDWLGALRSGGSLITNGPWLEFEVAGSGPGEAVELAGLPAEGPHVSATAAGRHDFGWLEVLDGGLVVASAPARPSERGGYEARVEIPAHPLDGPAWLAARIRPAEGVVNELGRSLFAHTSAVYVRENGRGVFRPDVAREIRREIRTASRFIAEQGHFDDEEERDRVLTIYREALEILEERLAE